MTKRFLGAALALIAVLGLLDTPAAGASPAPNPGRPRPRPRLVHGAGLSPDDTRTFGCVKYSMCIVKPNNPPAPSCTGYSSQTTPPSSIRVLVHTSYPDLGPYTIKTVPFEQYVEDVLPNEWPDSYDGDSLKAGAVAVKSYAWYWVTHYGGYLGTQASQANQTSCFDVTDDQNFQVYVAGSATSCPDPKEKTCTTRAVEQTWPYALRRDGQIMQASFVADLNPLWDPKDVHPVLDTCGQDANGQQLSQDGSQACNQDNTANKWPFILQLYYGTGIQIATTAQLRTQHDFRYLHTSTEATFNAGTWSLDDVYGTVIRYGQKGDIPVVNTAGDGFARVGVYRPSNHTFYFASPVGKTTSSITFGNTGDVPVAAQYNRLTAPTQAAVFRPSNGTWYLATTSGKVASAVQYGARGDIPVPGRWTSASADTLAVYRPSTGTWYRKGAATVHFGAKGDIPVPADYNGDGITDVAVFRPSTGTFYVYGHAGVQFGAKTDVPVTGDFTGDGKADLAVYRPSTHTWYVRGGSTTVFGSTGATPIGKAPYAD